MPSDPKFEGAKYVMSPPLPDKRNQDMLWNALRQRIHLHASATDHAPFDFKRLRSEIGPRRISPRSPTAFPRWKIGLICFYTHGVDGAGSTSSLRRLRQHPGGETLRPVPAQGHHRRGSDADLVVYDPNYRGKISQRRKS